jgi:predicted nucleotidyltransferase
MVDILQHGLPPIPERGMVTGLMCKGFEKVVLFGSVVEGEERLDSDVDILIIISDRQI